MRGVLACVAIAVAVPGCGFQPNAAGVDSGAGGGGSSDAGHLGSSGVTPPGDASTDGAPSDGSSTTTTPAACPSGAGWFQVGGQASWYFESSSGTSWKSAETDCEALQLSGGSAVHLAVLSTDTELMAVSAHDTSQDYWIGMFQPAHQATPAAGWLWITGGDGIAGVWASGEPNDAGGWFSRQDYENDDEDFAELYANSSTLNDDSDGTNLRYLCECDGVVVPAAIRAQIP